MMLRPTNRTVSVGAIAVGVCLAGGAIAVTPQELEAKVQALSDQLDEVKAELVQLKAQQKPAAEPAAPQQVARVGETPQSRGQSAPQPAPVVASAPDSIGRLSFFSYGEMNYSHPTHDSSAASADLARYVLGTEYRFDENTTFASELELEHAVSSASDPGEIEVEQAYIERRFNDSLFAKIGLFLIPSGLLNENHEPTRYYGVFRNYVETAIIPTTWREGGVEVQGVNDSGITWNLGLTTGFNLNKWDANSSEGSDSPLGSIHQELAQAGAGDLSGFAAINYTGIPGFKLGASMFSGGAAQGPSAQGSTVTGSARVTLWEAHARWSPADWEFSALYARGRIGNTAAPNLLTVGSPTPIPQGFFGWYTQAAYRAIERDQWSLAPFLRYERFNTASDYAFLGSGLTPASRPDAQVFTGGVNWGIAQGVVIKADYLNFLNGSGDNRFDLGLGFEF